MQKKRDAGIAKENMKWGSGAFLAVAVAVVSVNAGPLLPSEFRVALHSSRFGSVDAISLGTQVAALEAEIRVLGRDNNQLSQRVAAVNRQGGAVSQRVSSLESTLPDFLERSANGDLIDQGFSTASIGTEQPSDSSKVRVRMLPMNPVDQSMPSGSSQDTPADTAQVAIADLSRDIAVGMDGAKDTAEAVEFTQSQFALDFGRTATVDAGQALWDRLQAGSGALLFGLEPLMRADADGDHLVVGPIADISQVLEVCQAFTQVGYTCAPVAFEGEKLSP